MEYLARQLLILALTWTTLLVQAQASVTYPDPAQVTMNEILLDQAKQIRYAAPDSAIQLLQLYHTEFSESGDTANTIEALLLLANTYGHQAHYKASYDWLWKALFLADAAQLTEAKARIYLDIGRYYSFYKRKEKALEYFNLSKRLNENLVAEGSMAPAKLVKNYYAFCATYRELNEPVLAQIYLDSCFALHTAGVSDIKLPYLLFERAFLLQEQQQYQEATELYHSILPWIQTNDPAYQVLVYTYMGDTYSAMFDFAKSEKCYRQALTISKEYHAHIDFSPLIHEKLSELYLTKKDYQQAYQQLRHMQELDQQFFDSRSPNNRSLLEIQDAFRKEQEEQKKRVQEQRLQQLEQEERVLFLQKAILIVSLLFLVFVSFLYFYHIRSKHRAEKLLIRKKQELERQKSEEILELKNKELAVFALKMIEKDEFLADLKQKISQKKQGANLQEIRNAVRTVSISNDRNWEEFEARFVSVNKKFYEQLKLRFPNLTQGDQKLCALIKLNFSSKDMAKLMGISVESVHTSRYRLRKKLKLSREVNLAEFITNV